MAIAARTRGPWASLHARLASELDFVSLPCPAPDSRRLLSWLDKNRADVLLLDERFLHRLDARSLRRLRAMRADLRVLVLCERTCSSLAEEILRNRFSGLLQRNDSADTYIKAVRAVRRGELWLTRELLQELVERQSVAEDLQRSMGAVVLLTEREAQAIGCLRCGLSNKQIAYALDIKEDTVKKHLRNAYAKLGVHRRSEIQDRRLTSSAQPRGTA